MKVIENELRIGNLLLDDESDKLVVVSRIESIEYTDWNSGDEFNVVVLEYGTKERYLEGDFRPILLTEEWLLKFDFLRHHLDYSNGVIYIKNVPENNEFEWGVFPNELGSGIQIKNRIKLNYVHQLQNLHFALTGEELTFNFK